MGQTIIARRGGDAKTATVTLLVVPGEGTHSANAIFYLNGEKIRIRASDFQKTRIETVNIPATVAVQTYAGAGVSVSGKCSIIGYDNDSGYLRLYGVTGDCTMKFTGP